MAAEEDGGTQVDRGPDSIGELGKCIMETSRVQG